MPAFTGHERRIFGGRLREWQKRLSDPNDLPEVATLDNGKHLFSWTRAFWTVSLCELWISFILIAWGIHEIHYGFMHSADATGRALYRYSDIPPIWLGGFMIFLALCQNFALFWWNRPLRLSTLFCSVVIFLYFTCAFWTYIPDSPGVFTMPVNALVATIRFLRLSARRD